MIATFFRESLGRLFSCLGNQRGTEPSFLENYTREKCKKIIGGML